MGAPQTPRHLPRDLREYPQTPKHLPRDLREYPQTSKHLPRDLREYPQTPKRSLSPLRESRGAFPKAFWPSRGFRRDSLRTLFLRRTHVNKERGLCRGGEVGPGARLTSLLWQRPRLFLPPFPLSKQETKQHDRRHPPFHFSHSRLDPPNAPCPGACRPRRVWPGTRQTWLASLTPRAHRLNRLGVCLGSLPVVGLLLGANYSFYLFSF